MGVFDKWMGAQLMASGGEVAPANGLPPELQKLLFTSPEWGNTYETVRNIGKTIGIVGQDYTPYSVDPNAGKVDYGQSNEIRGSQLALIQALQNQVAGKGGPSLAQLQLQQATDANMKQAMALGAAQQGQGLGYAAALRGIADNQAGIQQQSAAQAAQLKMMEQLRAQEQLASLLGGTRGQDIGSAQYQTGALTDAEQLKMNAAYGWQDRQFGSAERAGSNFRNTLAAGGQGFASAGTSGAGKTYAMSEGGAVPGTPDVPGDSPENDDVPTMLSPGEIVIPRSIAQSKDAPSLAAAFVQAIQSQSKRHPLMGPGMAEGGEVPATETEPGFLDTLKNAGQTVADIGGDALDFLTSGPLGMANTALPAIAKVPAAAVNAVGDAASSVGSFVKRRAQEEAPNLFGKPGEAPEPPQRPPSLRVQGAKEQPAGEAAPAPAAGGKPSAQAPGAPRPASLGLGAYKSQMAAGQRAQTDALTKQGDVAEQRAQEEADIRGKAMTDAAGLEAQRLQMQAEYTKTRDADMQKFRELTQQYTDQSIDPHKFWGSRTTGDKVLAGIGMALSALGSNNGSNAAVDIINNAISRDIDAQKANLDKVGKAVGMQQTLLGVMREHFKDDAMALAAARATMYEDAGQKIEAMKARTGGQLERAKLEELQGKLAQGYATEVKKVEMQAEANAADAGYKAGMLRLNMQEAAAKAAKARAGSGVVPAALNALDAMRAQHKKVGPSAYLGKLPGTEGNAYADMTDANIMLLAAAITPGGKAPRSIKEAKERLANLPGAATFSGEAASRFDEIEKAILRAQHSGAGVEPDMEGAE